MNPENAELVAAIVDGAIHRYAEIVQHHDALIRREVRQRISDSATVDDLVQETFYLAFKRLDSLQDSRRLDAWLSAIARNCVRAHLRRTARRSARETRAGELSGERRCELDSNPSGDWIWDEVAALTREHRQVLHCRYELGLSYREIAARESLPESTVRGRLVQARKALRKHLEKRGLEP